MSQINIRLKDDEYDLIRRWALQRGISITSAFREITNDAISDWKTRYILQEYKDGRIRLKEAWKISQMKIMAFLKLIADNEIEPPHTEIMETKSTERAMQLRPEIVFKQSQTPKRTTPELELPEADEDL